MKTPGSRVEVLKVLGRRLPTFSERAPGILNEAAAVVSTTCRPFFTASGKLNPPATISNFPLLLTKTLKFPNRLLLGFLLGEIIGYGLLLGEGEGLGDGEGLGLGEGDGEGEGLMLGLGEGLGEGDGEGLGDGLGEGEVLGEGLKLT